MITNHAIAPVDPCDVFVISGYVLNVTRGRKKIDNVFSLDGKVYADIADAGLEAFDPNQVKTYRYDIVERNINGEDVETVELNEVEWSPRSKSYEDTGDSL